MRADEQREEAQEVLTVTESGERLDVFLSRSLGLTRGCVQKLLKEGRVRPGNGIGSRIKPSLRTEAGQVWLAALPEERELDVEPEEVPFDVLYEDESLAVIDKPSGLVVHPAAGNWRGTLVHGLLWRYPSLRSFPDLSRAGIVHRLDAGTSGLMVVALTPEALEGLQAAFRERAVQKEYLALVCGEVVQDEGTLSGPIERDPSNRLRRAVVEGGRPARTGYRVLWRRSFPGKGMFSLLTCSLYTGRTHQIRVHLTALGHPLVGDVLYGAPKDSGLERVFLHSWKLSFCHPQTGIFLSFKCPLPLELRNWLGSFA